MMKKQSVLLALTFVSHIIWAQPKTINSNIERVTVFFSGAQVTRTANTPLSIGRSEWVFKSLASNFDVQSVQVRGEGDFTVLSVTPRINYLESPTKRDTISDLQQQLDVLQDRLALENNQVTILQQEETFLQRNQVQLLGVPNTTLKLDDLKQAADYQRIRMSEILSKKFEIQKGIAKLQVNISKIGSQLRELNVQKNTISSEIVVVVNTPAATSAKFTLAYIVPSASWTPTYDIRVKDISTPLSMQMKANVRQASGEEWKNVKLTLSSGNPTESGVKPELETWRLDFFKPTMKLYERLEEPVGSNSQGNVLYKKATTRISADTDKASGSFSIQVAERQQTTTTSFDIELPYTIPTDNKPQMVDIKSLDLPVNYQYFVAPKLDKDAFLTAQIIDWAQYNLLSGEANVFLEGTFMGKTVLNTVTTDDTLNISLGRDKNVVVTRTKLKDFTKTKFLSDKRTDSRGFETVVRNKRGQPLSITVEDQIPISMTKDIEIVPETGDAVVDLPSGKLTWKLDVPAGKEKKVKFNYKVTYPKTQKVILE